MAKTPLQPPVQDPPPPANFRDLDEPASCRNCTQRTGAAGPEPGSYTCPVLSAVGFPPQTDPAHHVCDQQTTRTKPTAKERALAKLSAKDIAALGITV